MGFRLAQMADLARQMQFTPHDQRGRQIAAAENLLLELDPTRAYPFDFVVFRITGYHAKAIGVDAGLDGFTGELLTGLALQHDLGLLIEMVSDSLDIRVQGLGEPVLTIEQVCEQFNASDKSIQRWRRRGLAARRFIFPDGRKRVGFLAKSVERFFAVHHDKVGCAANFSLVQADEKSRIVASARRLAIGGCCADEIFRRLGRRLDRSALTIAHVVREHDLENPRAAILPMAPAPLEEAGRTAVVTDFYRGVTLKALAGGLNRPASAIYRVLLEHRLERLGRRKVKFFDDPLYHQPDAAAVIDDLARSQSLDEGTPREDQGLPRNLPPYIAALYRCPLLTPSRERGLFLKLHFHKFQFVELRQKLEAHEVRWRELDALEGYLRQAEETKNQIVAANLRLVVSVARKHLPAGRLSQTLMDLVSDGNVTLMRAADAFDCHRGNRFSTYATLALMKEFARAAPIRRRHDVSLMDGMNDVRPAPTPDRVSQRDEVRQLLSRLPEREQTVLRAQFGLADESGRAPASLEEVGRDLGISKERIRQIERIALAKLRADAEADAID